MVVSDEFSRNVCLNEPRERVFIITDGKSVYADKKAYREVVLQRGDEIVDIVYERGAWRASHDRDMIKSQLITYGWESAKELAEYIKQEQEQFNNKLKESE